MYATEPEDSTTEFRKAEKKYQRRFEQIVKYRKGKACGSKQVLNPTDFSEVINVDDTSQHGQDITCHPLLPPLTAGQLYLFRRHPGFLLLRNALTPETQKQLITDCLTQFPDHPATTNFTRDHGTLSAIWTAAQQGLYLVPTDDTTSSEEESLPGARAWREVRFEGAIPATKLLDKLRWASIGPQFDWTRRIYVRDGLYRQVPPYLINLSSTVTQSALATWKAADPETYHKDSGEESEKLCYDASLVNYYKEGDTLGGHLDDAELNMSHPICSISLGCPGVLLMGGADRSMPPTALWLRGGDVVIFAGPSRKCYHGVPRIVSDWGGLGGDAKKPEGVCGVKEMDDYMDGCRINISMRGTK